MQDVNILYELFYSTNMFGLLGPLAMITLTYLLTHKNKGLGVLWWLVDLVMMGTYMDLVEVDMWFIWHMILLGVGGFVAFIEAAREG